MASFDREVDDTTSADIVAYIFLILQVKWLVFCYCKCICLFLNITRTQGVIFDATANENAPWYVTFDLDWDVSNDTPINEDTANAILKAGRNIYAVQEYFPYSLCK